MKSDKQTIEKCTYRYIQLEVSRLGLPVNHSGAKVIHPAVNHVSALYSNIQVH
jgi:hypothetical protein